jgi:ribosomal protein S4E
MPTAKTPTDVRDGDHCVVTGGTHTGKSGIVEDRKISKTGHVTITVRLADGDRVKTLARNVVVQPTRAAAPKRKRPAP